ncbi:MAG: RNA polymerase sigma-70 factor [Bacteroidales bacterium]|jgi:RNA polymerase sigma-70 factor (ECF subfamily)|nr:RNA polymerase sigma-70 factor [Bacteroidales bacterium]
MAYSQHDFEKIYKLYYPKLFGFARNYIPTDEDTENIVQDVFLILWEKRNELEISYTFTSWLFTLMKNKCLNFLRHKVIEEKYKNQMQEELSFKLYALESQDYSYQSEKDLEERIRQALDALPERCREIFIKSRMKGMKYKEISEELGISVNTVENQMVTALKKLRIELKDFLPLFLFLVK